ncbi:hypothetical protein FF38_02841 [Lucilia cuprina]|uniref:Uncharacterized protein n=1 Tax=Lucilia cuprina TaxID=7375 RepID=A0A0L0CG14_LUCCU|nr:hypothetical protein FF38_02841 [Lucilia cuprina]
MISSAVYILSCDERKYNLMITKSTRPTTTTATKSKGFTIQITTNTPNITNAKCVNSDIKRGKLSSMAPISLEKRFKIRPEGLVSKNRMVALTSLQLTFPDPTGPAITHNFPLGTTKLIFLSSGLLASQEAVTFAISTALFEWGKPLGQLSISGCFKNSSTRAIETKASEANDIAIGQNIPATS